MATLRLPGQRKLPRKLPWKQILIALALAAVLALVFMIANLLSGSGSPASPETAVAQEEDNPSFVEKEIYWGMTDDGRVSQAFREKLAPDEFFAASVVNATLTFGLPEGTTVNSPPYDFQATHGKLEKLRSCISAVDRAVHKGSPLTSTTWNVTAYTITFLGTHTTRPDKIGLPLDPRVSVKSNNFLLEFRGDERIGFKPFDVRVAVLTYSNNPRTSQNWSVTCPKT